ncbi:hypothetical protein [Paenirhodobacter populi]|uniref:hypothetical protein n=1 Tax=Paenirhodobacter populi TaxID=2306993 RepID=UPI000FE349C4|nr:hypothetical protein [Sinirhodobacter populi]RWR09776.1 hypothetical protein D2T32_05390 [Sinirhodobacter populi]
MNDMNPRAVIGGNAPPDPLDEAISVYSETLELAEGILTGQPVQNDTQMRQVDEVAKSLKEAKKAVEDAKEGEYRPFKDGCDRIVQKYQPTLKDLDTQIKGCNAMVNDFKVAKRKAQEEEQRRKDAEARRKMQEAEEAARAANAADLDAQREAEAKIREAKEAAHAAAEAKRDTVKGLRTVYKWAYEIDPASDPKAARRPALNDIAVNDPDAIAAFVDDYVARNFRSRQIAGVRTWSSMEAF